MMTNKLKNRISKLAVRLLTAQLEDDPKSTGLIQFWISNYTGSVFCRGGQWFCKAYCFPKDPTKPIECVDIPI